MMSLTVYCVYLEINKIIKGNKNSLTALFLINIYSFWNSYAQNLCCCFLLLVVKKTMVANVGQFPAFVTNDGLLQTIRTTFHLLKVCHTVFSNLSCEGDYAYPIAT